MCNSINNKITCSVSLPQSVNTQRNEDEYTDQVDQAAKAVSEIQAWQYTKVIVSRAIDFEGGVDIPGTLLRGRRSNTPARSFALNHGGFEATGFTLDGGKVVTEPLAALGAT